MSANVFKVGDVWHYRFQVAGTRVQKSTRLRNRALAEQLAQRVYDDAVLRANGGEPVPTLDDLAGAWLEVHRPIVSIKHLASIDTFRRLHMYRLGSKTIDDIGTKDVETARNEHLVTHRPASANHWLRVLKLLSLWAVDHGVMAALPWKVAMLKLQKRPRAILPLDVTRAWFEAIDKATRRAPAAATAVRMMFGLGLREGEAAGARWEWFDWERKTYTPGITKGREAEPVPVPNWLTDYLTPHRRADGLVAPRRDGTPFPPGFARTAMRAANATCGLKGITPHRLRGTFATLLSEAGVPIQTIQAVLRHKHPMTTMAYLEKSLDTAARAQNLIGDRIDFTRTETGAANATPPSGN